MQFLSLTRRRSLVALAATLSLAALLAAQAQETTVKFQLDWRFEGPAALFLVPVAKGYFKAEGLNVVVDASNAPLVGFLNSASPATYRFHADFFRQGLAQAGFVEGRNVRIEERWANGDYNALPALANELTAMGVVAIAATGDVASARAAQGASTTVPIVFTIGGDPVRFGLVASFNRPGGNLTGANRRAG